jgi:hypothetical protein
MKPAGRTIPLSLPRRWVGDLAAFSQNVPTVAGEKILRVKALAAARRGVPRPPSWGSLVTKAFGIVSARTPELRRSYLSFPFPRLYEHPSSVAAIVANREFHGEPAVFLGLMQVPESLSLREIEARLRQLRESPFDQIGSYRRLIRTTRLPRPVRRLLWWYGLCVAGKEKSRTFGTFAVNSLPSKSVRLTHFLNPITSMLYYGSSGTAGELAMQMAFDHRVFDGVTAVRALSELQGVLNGEMVAEVAGAWGNPGA